MLKKFKVDLEFILKKGLDISPDCFGVLNKEDIVVYCNETFASAFGLAKKQVVGRSNKELLRLAWSTKKGIVIETDDFEKWYLNIEKLHKEKPLNQFETDLGDGRWFQMTRINLGDDYTLLFGSNITELKKTQASLEKANQQIKVLANTDQLTGVNNRRSFNVIADLELTRAFRYHQPLSLLLIDLDYFKQVNDNYGHESGDVILKEFAAICKEMLRLSDALSRIGGEEFTVVLPMTDLAAAHVIAERIRIKIAQHDFYLSDSLPHVKVSVSIGISSLTDPHQSIKDLLVQADMALYTAKKNGRNQVVEYQ